MSKIHNSEENQNLIRKFMYLFLCSSLWLFQFRIFRGQNTVLSLGCPRNQKSESVLSHPYIGSLIVSTI